MSRDYTLYEKITCALDVEDTPRWHVYAAAI